jgi:hypothetical protein
MSRKYQITVAGCGLEHTIRRVINWGGGDVSIDYTTQYAALNVGDIIEYTGDYFPSSGGSDEFPVVFFKAANYSGAFSPTSLYLPTHYLTEVSDDCLLTELILPEPKKPKEQPPKTTEAIVENADNFSDLLIHHHYPFDEIHNGELKERFGIELVEIYKDRYEKINKYIEAKGYGWLHQKKDWQQTTYLEWGSKTGWNVSNDEKLAVCRKEYDEYYVFEIKK